MLGDEIRATTMATGTTRFCDNGLCRHGRGAGRGVGRHHGCHHDDHRRHGFFPHCRCRHGRGGDEERWVS